MDQRLPYFFGLYYRCPDAFSMDTFRLLLMRKVDLILYAYTHHGLRFSVSGGLAGILYMPRYLSAGRPTHIFTIASGWRQLVSFVYMAFHARII